MRSVKELVIVVFAGVLLALMMSAAVSTSSAKLVQCNNNLKGILQKMQSYVDSNEVMPPVWSEGRPVWTFWDDKVDPDCGLKPEWVCPEDTRNAHMFAPADPLVPTIRRRSSASYGMNEKMHTYNSKKRRATMHDFIDPEKLIIFGDAKIPMLQPIQNPGNRRHDGKFHYITASGAIRLYTDKDLGGAVNGKFNVKPELWYPWSR